MSYRPTSDANITLGLTVVVLLTCWLRDVQIAIENPRGALVAQIEPMRAFLQTIFGTNSPAGLIYMGAFGVESQKPLWIFGDWWGIQELQRPQPTRHLNNKT